MWKCWIWKGVKDAVRDNWRTIMLNSGTLQHTGWKLYFQERARWIKDAQRMWQETMIHYHLPHPKSAWKEREGMGGHRRGRNQDFIMEPSRAPAEVFCFNAKYFKLSSEVGFLNCIFFFLLYYPRVGLNLFKSPTLLKLWAFDSCWGELLSKRSKFRGLDVERKKEKK